MSDSSLTAVLVVSLAALVTSHLTIVAGLLARPPRWRAAAALVLFPLAPFWALRGAMRGRFAVWIVSLTVYVVAFAAVTKRERAIAWIEPDMADLIPVHAREELAPLRLA